LGALLAELERVQEENERLKAAGSDGGFVLGEVEEDEDKEEDKDEDEEMGEIRAGSVVGAMGRYALVAP
jgi:hypothetical protein